MKKKVWMILVIIIFCVLVFFMVDYCRVKRQKRPIFCIPSPGIYLDGGTVEYFGLGYKVIDFNRLGGYNEIKIGTWFMKYEDFKEEYGNEPDLILIEQLEAIGFEDGKTVIIKGDNYSTILDILNRQKFDQEINITIDGEDYKTIMNTI